MKGNIFVFSILVFGLLMLSSCSHPEMSDEVGNDECTQLKESFDEHVGTFDMQKCKEYKGQKLMVGGTLKNIKTTYDEAYNRYKHTLEFQGRNRSESIVVNTFETDTIPYTEGIFYEFDLTGNCPLLDSSASSGAFSDPDLDAFKKLNSCN